MENVKSSRFKKAYLVYLTILTILVVGLLITLWIAMFRYQRKLDNQADAEVAFEEATLGNTSEDIERTAQQCFMDYADSLNEDKWVEIYYQNHPDMLDSNESVRALINESITSKSLQRYKADDFSLDAPKYILSTNDEIIAVVNLSGGAGNYQVSGCELLVCGDKQVTFTAPRNCQVTINGSPLLEGMAETTEMPVKVDGYDDKLENPATLIDYKVSGLIADENLIEVENASQSEDGNFYGIIADETTLKSKASDFVAALLHYYAIGKEDTESNMNAALSHVAGSSAAATTIRSAASGLEWVPADRGASFDIETSETFRAADNCCFVDVSYRDVRDGENVNAGVSGIASGIYRVYLLDSGEGYKIVQFSGIK